MFLELGILLKKRFPGIHVTMGGSYLTQWAMLMDEALLAELFTCTDSVVCGEGEEPFCDLLVRIVDRREIDGLPNVIWRDDTSGDIRFWDTIITSDPTGLPSPDFSDLDLSAYLLPEPILPYTITRGCYWQKCAFCQNHIAGYKPRRYQTVPIDKALSELSALTDMHGCKHFHFCSDVIDPDYLKSFSEAVIASKNTFSWNTDLRVEEAFTEDLCQRMADAGLNSVTVGVESGCRQTLDAMDKGTEMETSAQVIKNLHNAGIAVQATCFFGFPGESERDAHQTFTFLLENHRWISNFEIGLLLVLPGSRIHDEPSKFDVGEITYRKNLLMTPEPLWKAQRRIPLAALDRIYNLMNMLESGYVMNDTPYVGSLCSNHSMLYFKLSPDALKNLRMMEDLKHQEFHKTFGIDSNHRVSGEIAPKIPRLVHPYEVFRSPYRIERHHFGETDAPGQQSLKAGAAWDLLLYPINIPL